MGLFINKNLLHFLACQAGMVWLTVVWIWIKEVLDTNNIVAYGPVSNLLFLKQFCERTVANQIK